MKTARRPSALTVTDRGRAVCTIASRRQCGGGATSLRAGTGMPCRSSLPIQMRSSGSATGESLLHPREGLADEGADRVEVVAALLDDDGGQAERAERATGGAVAAGAHAQGALGIAGGGIDAQSDDQSARAAPGRPAGQLRHRREPRVVAAPRRQWSVAVRPLAGARPGLAGEAEKVREPTGA